MAEAQGRKSGKSGLFILLTVVILAGLGLWLLSIGANNARDRALDKSPIGLAGLAPWLRSQGLDARTANPRLILPAEDFGLTVVPLYDVDLYSYENAPDNREERIAAPTLRQMDEWEFNQKINRIPALVALPKWRGAMVELGVAHEQSLIAPDDLDRLKLQLGLGDTAIVREGPEFIGSAQRSGERVELFHAQLFDRTTLTDDCREVIGLDSGALVLRCQWESDQLPVWFLSDPDLLNNHGLAVADNATFTASFLGRLQEEARPGAIYVDFLSVTTTKQEWEDERQDYSRDSEEFSRFFEYPFSLLWASLLIVSALAFWRGSLRFGPINQFGMGAQSVMRERTKRVSLGAKARLLRLSGHDGQLVSDLVRAQMADLARNLLGRDEGLRGTERALAMLARRDPELAQEFGAVSQGLIEGGPAMPPHQLSAQLAQYQSLRNKVMNIYGFV
ncbi:hypothetical protein Q0601_13565 [Paracoccus onubensis]|uniref:hypothetical protein n=1 Tax=Paracoccus onubensis TaxID=1675788 RepID=UPI00273222E2|nr:hypothetical protein [Paracoccus onubensis]MDP0928209.1 hypothetical protein [Paracoccus onubensis]